MGQLLLLTNPRLTGTHAEVSDDKSHSTGTLTLR